MPQSIKPLMLAALAALLGACGAHNSPFSAGGTHAAPNQGSHAGGSGSQGTPLDPDMVAGVSPGGSNPPIGLRFKLDTRPVVGEPAQLVLALTPTPGVEISHIHASLQVADGLQLQSARGFDIDAPQSGVPVEQTVTVVPQRAGVLSLSATLEIDADSGSVSRTYEIPLIASSAS